MRIVIPGGSGQVGGLLSRAFHQRGHEVIVLSRAPTTLPWRTIGWDARTLGPWAQALEGADVVINLAGRSVNCRYTARHRREILESRVDSTRVLGFAIAAARRPPPIWLQASTATIYAHRDDAPNDEESGLIGGAEADAPAAWQMDAQRGRLVPADRDGAGAQEPAGGAGAPAERGIPVWVSDLAGSSRRALSALAATASALA